MIGIKEKRREKLDKNGSKEIFYFADMIPCFYKIAKKD